MTLLTQGYIIKELHLMKVALEYIKHLAQIREACEQALKIYKEVNLFLHGKSLEKHKD